MSILNTDHELNISHTNNDLSIELKESKEVPRIIRNIIPIQIYEPSKITQHAPPRIMMKYIYTTSRLSSRRSFPPAQLITHPDIDKKWYTSCCRCTNKT